MRAFKHVSTEEESLLHKLFPSLLLYELHDDHSVIKLPISFWDKWFKDVDTQGNEIPFDCSDEEERRRYNLLYGLAADIVREYEVYGLFYGRGGVKKVRSKQRLIKDLEHHQYTMRPLLIPELNAIYDVSYDFTGFIYCKSVSDVEPILSMANDRGLKLIEYL